MDKFLMYLKLAKCFPMSFLNHNGEVIVHKYSNTYFCLQNCESELDVKCKLLEWLSRAAHKTAPYTTARSNATFHRYILNGINEFLGTNFNEDDMDIIYTRLGNAIRHDLTVQFVQSGYDMNLLRRD